jgi:hypothetical protein
MLGGKALPMPGLLGGEHSRSLAEWTGVVERAEHGVTDELGLVRQASISSASECSTLKVMRSLFGMPMVPRITK